MPRLYTVSFENVAVAASQDLFELTCADDKPIGIVGIIVDNVGGAADAGDAQEEFLRCLVVRGNATSGSGGSAPTPIPANPSDAAASFTAEANNTTPASTGTPLTLCPFNVGSRSGADFPLLPVDYALMTNQTAGLLCVRLPTAPADSINLSGTLFVIEW